MAAPVLAVEHRLPANTGSGIPFTLSKKKFKRTCTHVRKCLRGNENYNKHTHTHTQNNNKITNVLGPIRFCLRPSLQGLTQDKLRRSIWLLPS